MAEQTKKVRATILNSNCPGARKKDGMSRQNQACRACLALWERTGRHEECRAERCMRVCVLCCRRSLAPSLAFAPSSTHCAAATARGRRRLMGCREVTGSSAGWKRGPRLAGRGFILGPCCCSRYGVRPTRPAFLRSALRTASAMSEASPPLPCQHSPTVNRSAPGGSAALVAGALSHWVLQGLPRARGRSHACIVIKIYLPTEIGFFR